MGCQCSLSLEQIKMHPLASDRNERQNLAEFFAITKKIIKVVKLHEIQNIQNILLNEICVQSYWNPTVPVS